jgi:Zn finger protein HypA/HybF involved in hydrogenase expression
MAYETLSRSLCSCNYCGETLEVRDWSDYCPACHAKGMLVFVSGIEPNSEALA